MAGPAPPHYLAVRPAWLSLWQEPALEPDLPIIDAHHHLWDRPGWRYLGEEYIADAMSGHNIAGSVFVQCQTGYRQEGPEPLRPVGETEYIRALARRVKSRTTLARGIVGHADLRRGAAAREVLEAHVRAGEGHFKGIRHIVVWDGDSTLMNPLSAGPPGLMADAAFREGFAALAPLNLTFDAWLFHPQIPELAALADAFPDTRIVLDHCGGVVRIGAYGSRHDQVFSDWSQSITALAKRPNVHVKLGGLGMRINGFGFEKEAHPPSSDALALAWRPYIEHCIAAFGTTRCMVESNFPVDKGTYAYGACWNAFKKLTRGFSEEERSGLFHDNAARFYSLGQAGTDLPPGMSLALI
jgi:L-fuconolactonase